MNSQPKPSIRELAERLRDKITGKTMEVADIKPQPKGHFEQLDAWLANNKPNPNPMVQKFGKDPGGRQCASCRMLERHGKYPDRNYYKCFWRGKSKSAATDHRLSWDACSRIEVKK